MMRMYGLVSLAAMISGGCSDPGQETVDGASDSSIFETSSDAVTEVDTTPEPPASLCALGCTPISVAGAPFGVTFTQPGGLVPSLAGGKAPDGVWVLRATELHTDGAFVEGLTVKVGDAGETAGRAIFGGDAMALVIDLHLDVTVEVAGTSGSGVGRGTVALGGCYERVYGELRGDLGSCASGFPEGTEPPDAVAYEHLGDEAPLRIGVSLSAQTLISLLPPEQQATAGTVIIGPIYLVATFERQ